MLATRRNFTEIIAPFFQERRLIFDTETTGLNPWRDDRTVGLSLATPDLQHIAYFPIRHQVGENIRWSQYQQITNLLSQKGLILTGWNIKFDVEMGLADGLKIRRRMEDVMLACHLLNENDKPFELKRWAAKRIDPTAGDAETALEKRLRQVVKEHGIKGIPKEELKKYIFLLEPKEVAPYACDDVRYTELLRRFCLPELKVWKLYDLWRELNHYLYETMRMEIRGMPLDVPLIQRYSLEAKKNWRRAEKRLFRLNGGPINCNSWKQLCAFLGTTSSAKAIVEVMGTPKAEALLAYRSWHKVDVDYYEKWLLMKDSNDVLHPNLLLHGTGTGRQSARNPPLHSTPRYRKEYKVKDVVVARPGYVLVSADYNQMELRVAASIAHEDKLAEVYARNGDVHQSVADELRISGPHPRDIAKSINFMMLYGGGALKLSIMAKIAFDLARQYINRYRTTYWKLRYAAKEYQRLAEQQGYIRLWSGRVRHFNHLVFANPKDAFNSAVQGGGAEMLRLSICRLGRQLRALDAWMLLQIHDQIISEVPEHRLMQCVGIIRCEMEAFDHWYVPCKVDFKVGPRWGQLVSLDEWRKAA